MHLPPQCYTPALESSTQQHRAARQCRLGGGEGAGGREGGGGCGPCGWTSSTCREGLYARATLHSNSGLAKTSLYSGPHRELLDRGASVSGVRWGWDGIQGVSAGCTPVVMVMPAAEHQTLHMVCSGALYAGCSNGSQSS